VTFMRKTPVPCEREPFGGFWRRPQPEYAHKKKDARGAFMTTRRCPKNESRSEARGAGAAVAPEQRTHKKSVRWTIMSSDVSVVGLMFNAPIPCEREPFEGLRRWCGDRVDAERQPESAPLNMTHTS